jgi:hypothetical protein
MNDETRDRLDRIARNLARDLFSMSPECWTNGTAEDMIQGALSEALAPIVVETTGRNDLPSLFKLSGILEDVSLDHTPFLAFVVKDQRVIVNIFKSARQMVSDLTPETPVMVQWAGRWRSDFFKMTVGDIKAELLRRYRRTDS